MNQDFTVQKKQYLTEKKIRAEGFTWKNKFLHKQWAKKKKESWKFLTPHPPSPFITFLMVRHLIKFVYVSK